MANNVILALLVSICFVSGINDLTHFRGEASEREESLMEIESRVSALHFWWPTTTTMSSHEEYTASQTSTANKVGYMESLESGVIRDTKKSGVLPHPGKRLVSRQGNHRHVYQLRL